MVSAGGSQGQQWKDHLSPSSREGMCRFQGQPDRADFSLPPEVPFLFSEWWVFWFGAERQHPGSLRFCSKKKKREKAAVAQSRAQLSTLFYQYCYGYCNFSVNCGFILKSLLVFSPPWNGMGKGGSLSGFNFPAGF